MRKVLLLWLCLAITSFGAAAQTAVTTSGGTTNAVPVYTGSTVLSNSPIFVSGSNVGVGTTTPLYPLDIAGTVALYGVPVLDKVTLSIPSDGVYVIASGGRIHGEYVVSWNESPNRAQTVHLLVNADQYDGSSTLQILENHSYQQNAILSNFRLLTSQDGQVVYLVMTVGNRNGGTSANVQYFGTADYGASFGGTLVGNESAIGVTGLASREGFLGVGTTNPGATLEVNGNVKLTSGSGASITFADGTVQTSAVPASLTTSNGNVGIGTSTPSQSLEVKGNAQFDSAIYGTFPQQGNISFNDNANLAEFPYLEQGDALRWQKPALVERNSSGSWSTYTNPPDFGYATDGISTTGTNIPNTVNQFRITYENYPGCLDAMARIQQAYQPSTFNVLVEASGNSGSSWSTLGSATGMSGYQNILNLAGDGCSNWLRFTFTITNYNGNSNFRLMGLEMVNTRPGDQGQLLESLLPINWDYNRNIGAVGNLTVSGTGNSSFAGNVGIGTTSPGATLEVNGNVKLTSGSGGSITFPDGTVQTTAVPANLTSSNGNVGIGTTTPSSTGGSLFNASSTGYIQGLFSSSASSGGIALTNYAGQQWEVQSDLYNSFEVYNRTAGIQPLTITSSGNVGIGTTWPSTKLEIEGSGANYTTGTEDELKLFRPLVGGVSFAQTAALSLGTYNNTGGCCGPQTRLDFKLENGQTGSDTVDTTVMTLLSNGSVGIGTTSPGAALEIHGNVKLTSGSGSSITFPDNTVQGTAWNGTTLGGDYAESVDVTGDRAHYEPGDVIVIDGEETGRFDKSSNPYSRMVAGVYSTKPGLIGRRTTAVRPNKEAEVPMAMMGIVPTKVSTENGPIERGDLLVSSSKPGYAMKGTDRDRLTGAIIGKALAPLKSGSGVIEVLLALQ